jgi:hypothetical protein
MIDGWPNIKMLCCTGLLLSPYIASASAGPAVNQFETKDLESAPGEMQFQSQNAISFGQPKRRIREDAPGDFTYDDNAVARERYALEMQMGITTWFRTRLGVEFEKERLEDPASPARANAFEDLHLTGIALEGVFVLLPVKKNGIGVGILTEYDHSIRGGASQFYFGPIIQSVSGPWSAIANLLMVQHYGSPDRSAGVPADRKRDFAYAAQLQYEVSPTWAMALEGYGTVDRLGHSGTQSAELAAFGTFDQHRMGPVIYYRFSPDGKPVSTKGPRAKGIDKDKDDDKDGEADGKGKDRSVSIGVGLLFGLNGNTPSETLKLSLEYNF